MPGARRKSEPKYYIPIPRPNPLANPPYKLGALASGLSVPGKPTPSQAALDAGNIHEAMMSAARAIIEEQSARKPRKSALDLAGLTKLASSIE